MKKIGLGHTDFMGVNSTTEAPILEGPRGQNHQDHPPISPTATLSELATTRLADPTLPSRAHLQD